MLLLPGHLDLGSPVLRQQRPPGTDYLQPPYCHLRICPPALSSSFFLCTIDFPAGNFSFFPLSHLLFPSLRCQVFERVSTLVTLSPLPLPHSLAALGGHQQLLTTEPPADMQVSSPRPLWVNPALFPPMSLPFLPPVGVLFLFLPPEHKQSPRFPASYLLLRCRTHFPGRPLSPDSR